MIIPKEQQTAYQRWEMSSFATVEQETEQAPVQPVISEEEIQEIYDKSRKEGYSQGMKEGYFAGLEQGKESLIPDKESLNALLHPMSDALNKMDEEIAVDVLKLALDLAKAMLKQQLKVNETLILPVVKEAIGYLPAVQRPARILLNPDDAVTVRTHMQEELTEQGWQVVDDTSLDRGGCRVETGANQIDASNELRWQRICEALGQVNGWVEE